MADGDFRSMDTGELVKVFADLPYPEKRKVWIDISDLTEEEFDAKMAWQKARREKVPGVGDEAPAFTLDVLDPEKGRTGETVSLESLRGKPVALIFGSYT